MHPGPGLQTPDFRKKSGVPPDSRLQISRKNLDSRLQISRKNLEYRGPGLQTPDFQKNLEYRGPGLQTSRKNLEYGDPRLQTPDFQKKSGVPGPWIPDSRFPEKIWSTGAPDSRLQISRKNLEYLGPQTPDYRLQNLESRVPVLQIFSGNLEFGVWRYSRFFLEIWSLESGGTPDFFWKSGVWSLEVLQISSGNLESGVWGYSRFFSENLESGVPPLPKPAFPRPNVWIMGGGGGEHIYIYTYTHTYILTTPPQDLHASVVWRCEAGDLHEGSVNPKEEFE